MIGSLRAGKYTTYVEYSILSEKPMDFMASMKL